MLSRYSWRGNLTPDPIFIYANYAEAVLWGVFGLAAMFLGKSQTRYLLGLAFIAFGLSDVVETRTGAWYDPWWLLAWKAACVLALVILGTIEARKWRKTP